MGLEDFPLVVSPVVECVAGCPVVPIPVWLWVQEPLSEARVEPSARQGIRGNDDVSQSLLPQRPVGSRQLGGVPREGDGMCHIVQWLAIPNLFCDFLSIGRSYVSEGDGKEEHAALI